MSADFRTSRPRVGYIVDVQEDFARASAPGGRLYVRHLSDPNDMGAERIIPQLHRLAQWMLARCDAVVYTRDAHRLDDAEISSPTPDFVNTYPVHCAAFSDDPAERAGAELIPEVAPLLPLLTLQRDASDADAAMLALRVVQDRLPVLVEKSRLSVWTGNLAMDAFVTALDASLGARPEIIACGLATDVCVAQGVDGFLERGYAVTVVRDAIYSLDGDDEAWLEQWAARGAAITTVDELLARSDAFAEPDAQSRLVESPR